MKTHASARAPSLFASSMALLSAVACAGGGNAGGDSDSSESEADLVRDVPVAPVRTSTEQSQAAPPLEDARRLQSSTERGSPVAADDCEDTCASKRAECGLVCDEECGSCATGEACDNGKCVCQSSCDGSRCIDSCGRPCACPFGAACDARGFCVAADTCADGPCPTDVTPPVTPILPPLPPAPEP